MTSRQREVLSFIVDRYVAGGPLPTGLELQDRYDWGSSRTAYEYFMAFEDQNAIHRANGSKRYGLVKTHPVIAEMLKAKREDGPRGKYSCGSCGEKGHNARTCRSGS